MAELREILNYLVDRDELARKEAEEARESARKDREALIEIIQSLKVSSFPGTSAQNEATPSYENKQPVILQSPEDFIIKQIGEFVYSPKDGLTFDRWYDRVNTIFASANSATLSEACKSQIIRSKLSQTDYQCFARTILPKKPEELSLAETSTILIDLFGRQETIFALRHKVMQIQMHPGENFRAYAARINQAAEEFELNSFAIDDLKAQLFTQGLRHPEVAALRKKVMEKIDDVLTKRKSETPAITPKLTLDDLASLALRMQTREEESKLVEHPQISKQEVFSIGRGPCKWNCRFCGEKHWHVDCPFKTMSCPTCNIIGHKTGHCASAKAFKERSKNRGVPNKILSTCTSKQTFRKIVRPLINGVRVCLKHDSGSDWVIISRSNWQRVGSPQLTPLDIQAISASGNNVEVLGYFSATVEMKDKFGIVACYVSPDELNLFGNSAMEALSLWNQPIAAYCDSISSLGDHFANEVRSNFPKLFSSSLGR